MFKFLSCFKTNIGTSLTCYPLYWNFIFSKLLCQEYIPVNRIFYKIMNKNMCNRGFKYKIGLNKLLENFNPSDECQNGGFYYCDLTNIPDWLYLYKDGSVCKVEIPLFAKTYKSKLLNKYKTDYIILGNPQPIDTFIQFNELELQTVRKNGLYLYYIKNKTRIVCTEALKQNGYALMFIEDQTPELCMLAVKQNGLALQHVKEQTDEICMEAVKQNGLALKHVKKQTYYICIEAVKQNEKAAKFINKQIIEVCIEVTKMNQAITDNIIIQMNKASIDQ